jgi:tetratricopeptide (TPR) repeat protein
MTSAPAPASGRHPLDYGLQLLKSGQPQAAVGQLQAARQLDPANPDILYALGNGLRLCDRPKEAAEALQAALTVQPGHVDAGFSLAFLYIQQANSPRAAGVLRALCASRPDDDALIEKAASLLAGVGENAAAAELYEKAAGLAPRRANLLLQLGVQYQKLGRYAEASSSFRQTIELDPRLGSAYMLLANTRRFTEADPALERLCNSSLALHGLGKDDMACIHFALGKIYDDSGRYDAAFEHYRRGNELRRPNARFDRQAWQQFVMKTQQVFQNVDFPVPKAFAADPAFIVGMLRSGTTLVSRLLSNAPSVRNIGETELLDAFVQRIAELKTMPYPECILQLDADELSAIAADYRLQLPSDGSQFRFVLDKNPLNFIHIGLIALLFPGAPIIHCKRNPLDTCLSIYFQNFAHARTNYAYDLEDIAVFYGGYSRLMAYWEERLPGRLISVEYEALVADTESTLRGLYERLDLPWTPAAARPEDNPANIATASAWQARQPIYMQSTGRWQHYAGHLGKLKEQLEKTGIKLDTSFHGSGTAPSQPR